MFKNMKLRLALAALAGVLVLGGIAAFVFSDALFRSSIVPPGRFAESKTPPAPDYANPEAWVMLPSTPPPGGWEIPWGVDVFFVPPLADYSGKSWSVPFNGRAPEKRLENKIMPNHAAPFMKAGPVYAPRYRAAALQAELNVGGDSDGAFEIAYGDVLAAFDEYMKNRNNGRGVMLAGVGQGGLYVMRLLHDRFQGEGMKMHFAAAYVLDAAAPLDGLSDGVSQAVCTRHDSIQCIVAFAALPANDAARANRFLAAAPVWTVQGRIAPSAGRKLACVNPLSWTVDGELGPRNAHRGGARANGANDLDPKILPGSVSAKCVEGVLEVDAPSTAALRPSSGWGAQYKTPEYSLFYADLAFNAAERARAASAWMDLHAPKPARPLPPVRGVESAAIAHPFGAPDPMPGGVGSDNQPAGAQQ